MKRGCLVQAYNVHKAEKGTKSKSFHCLTPKDPFSISRKVSCPYQPWKKGKWKPNSVLFISPYASVWWIKFGWNTFLVVNKQLKYLYSKYPKGHYEDALYKKAVRSFLQPPKSHFFPPLHFSFMLNSPNERPLKVN